MITFVLSVSFYSVSSSSSILSCPFHFVDLLAFCFSEDREAEVPGGGKGMLRSCTEGKAHYLWGRLLFGSCGRAKAPFLRLSSRWPPLPSGELASCQSSVSSALEPLASIITGTGMVTKRRRVRSPEPSVTTAAVLSPSSAGTAGYKLLVPRFVAFAAAVETAADELPMKSLILQLQQGDAFVTAGAWKKWLSHSLRAGKVHWKISNDGLLRFKDRVYVAPEESARQELLRLFHDASFARHLGIAKTREQLSREFYWDSLLRDVKNHVNSCAACQKTKPRHHKPYGLLAPLPVPTLPMQEILLNFVTGVPPSMDPVSDKPSNAILVLVNREDS